jgi:hypothetical protein
MEESSVMDAPPASAPRNDGSLSDLAFSDNDNQPNITADDTFELPVSPMAATERVFAALAGGHGRAE